MVGKGSHHPAHLAAVDTRGELAVGIGPGSAFAVKYIALGIENSPGLQENYIIHTLFYGGAPLKNVHPGPRLDEAKSAEKTCRAGAYNQGPEREPASYNGRNRLLPENGNPAVFQEALPVGLFDLNPYPVTVRNAFFIPRVQGAAQNPQSLNFDRTKAVRQYFRNITLLPCGGKENFVNHQQHIICSPGIP
jgi:hypothetical protein